MPRRSRIRIGALEDLAEQLRFAPRRTLLRQIERAEELAAELDPDRAYPEDWVVWRITGYRREIAEPAMLVGEALLGDLSALCERLSDEAALTSAELKAPLITLPELCERWGVSRRTIERYRRRGLLALRIRNDRRNVNLVFRRASVERFERERGAELVAARDFSRMTEEERRRAGALRQTPELRELSVTRAAAAVAPQLRRGRETIRRALARAEGVAGAATLPRRTRLVIWRAWQWGVQPGDIAQRFGRTRATVHRIVNQRRAELLRGLDLSGPAGAPGDEALEHPASRRGALVADELSLRAFLERCREQPAPDAAEERTLARAYCHLRRRAGANVPTLRLHSPSAHELDAIETDLRWASQLKRRLVASQLPLLIRSVEERLGPLERSPAQALRWLEVGAAALGGAVDLFDPYRGGRLAAAASLALVRALAGAQPAARDASLPVRAAPAGTPAPQWTAALAPWDAWLAPPRGLLEATRSMAAPAGDAVAMRFGLSDGPPRTIAAIASAHGVSEGRVVRWTHEAFRIARTLRAGGGGRGLVA